MDYTKFCFVIMPFAKKRVGDKEIDFDWIYDHVFVPGISAVKLPEGGNLIPKRTDKDFASSDISQEMFEYLEYSRVAIADISGLNANVFYEVGVRHRARESGTVIFRILDSPIPFDINQIKAFPYEYEPDEKLAESVKLVTRTLEESLAQNRLDSPVQIALRAQKKDDARVESLIKEAEEAIRREDAATALAKYEEAIRNDGQNALLHVRAGLLHKNAGRWEDALSHFVAAVAIDGRYAEAWRERGIAENKIHLKKKAGPTGEESLQRAVALNPSDFDALASLGGVLKRAQQWGAAADAYARSTEVSLGHPYPLLNWITIRAREDGKLQLSAKETGMLKKARQSLTAQVATEPAYNTPWTIFDYAQAQLFLGNSDEFIEYACRGIREQTADWQPGTFADTLQLLVDGGIRLPRLEEGIELLRKNEWIDPDELKKRSETVCFNQDDVLLLSDLLICVGYGEQDKQDDLFLSMAPELVASLPIAKRPDSRLRQAIDVLNRMPRLRTGELPMEVLLKNAINQNRLRAESQPLEQLLAKLKKASP